MILVLGLAPATARAAATGPSFDCKRAATRVEHEICRKPYLAAYDRRIAALYGEALGVLDAEDADQLRTDQRLWLKLRDDCNYQTPENPHARTDVEGCLADVLMFRVNALQKVVADKKFSRPCHPQNC
ncbi:MAG TPA: lysozyme inhibitor LprI family protein [Xanthobacteraceae bacterium]|nr:lysozyme inhibitor LprI family protein [Xanthobacteraceae bacterium]